MELTTQELDRLLALKNKKSYADLADQFFGDRSLGSALRSTMRKYTKSLLLDIPEPADITFPPPLVLSMENTLVIGDLHAPFHNKQLLKQAITLAKAANVTNVDIAGDLHDFNSLSSYARHETFSAAETDIAHSRQIVSVLAADFNVAIVSGNHDEYWVKKRGGTFEDLIYQEVLQGKLRDRVTATNYDYLIRGDWIIGHISNYHDIAGHIAAQIAEFEQMNVAVGHDHLRGHVYTPSQRLGISIGAMLTPNRFWYKVRRLAPYPQFMLGFLLIIDNKPYHFSDVGNTSLNGEIRDFSYWEDYFRNEQFYT